jgi:hypothetical protein
MGPVLVGAVSGTLVGGGQWALAPAACSLRDVQPLADTVLVLTSGGLLGAVDPDTLELRWLRVGEPRLQRFDDGGEPFAVDEAGDIWRIDPSDGALQRVASLGARVLRFRMNGVRPDAIVLRGDDVAYVHGRVRRRLPASSAWMLDEDGAWWALDRGEFGGSYGSTGGVRGRRPASGFLRHDGGVLGYGGLVHFTESSWIFDATTARTLYASDAVDPELGSPGPAAPIAWMGKRSDGRLEIWTELGARYAVQMTPAGQIADWQSLPSSWVSPSQGRAYAVGYTTGIRRVATGPAGRIWAATTDGLLRADDHAVTNEPFAELPSDFDDLELVDGTLVGRTDDGALGVLRDGRWTVYPLAVPGVETGGFAGSTWGPEGPTFWWVVGDDLVPVGPGATRSATDLVAVLQSPDGQIHVARWPTWAGWGSSPRMPRGACGSAGRRCTCGTRRAACATCREPRCRSRACARWRRYQTGGWRSAGRPGCGRSLSPDRPRPKRSRRPGRPVRLLHPCSDSGHPIG